MKKIAVILIVIAVGLLWVSALQAKSLRAEGRYTEQSLTNLPTFNAIEVRGDAQVEIWQRDMQSVNVSGKANLVALADIRVENNTLIVEFKRPVHIKGSDALHVTITTPLLEAATVHSRGHLRLRGGLKATHLVLNANDQAELDGDSINADTLRLQALNQADIDLERIQVKKLEASASDKAQIELSGSAENAQLTNNSREDIEADSLRVSHATVITNAQGDVELFATHTLKAQANAGGRIIYHGQPVLTRGGNTKKIRPAFED